MAMCCGYQPTAAPVKADPEVIRSRQVSCAEGQRPYEHQPSFRRVRSGGVCARSRSRLVFWQKYLVTQETDDVGYTMNRVSVSGFSPERVHGRPEAAG